MNKYLALEYPYYNLSYKLDKKKVIQDVKNYKPIIYTNEIPHELQRERIDKYDGKYFIIKENYNDSSKINDITDYFSEVVRVKCRFGNYLSPLEYWTQNKKMILQKAKELSINAIRDAIFFNTKLCNNFRITVALTVLEYFKPKKWLDISAGWGDRLMAAILYKVKLYVSVDPNLDLHPCYDKMIETFVTPSKRKNFIIYKNGFLEAKLPDEKFDIVFSSPPFFTLEIYSQFEENSVMKHKTEKEWCDNFLVKSLIKAYNYLKKDGIMVLYMGGSPYVMQQMHKLDKIMKYMGIIYFYEKRPRGMFVWKKINDDVIKTM